MRPVALMRVEVLDMDTCPVCEQLHGVVVQIGSGDENLVRALAHPNCRREVVEIYAEDLPPEWAEQLYSTPAEIRQALGVMMQAGDVASALAPREAAREVVSATLGYASPEWEDLLLDWAYRDFTPADPELAAMVRALREALGLIGGEA